MMKRQREATDFISHLPHPYYTPLIQEADVPDITMEDTQVEHCEFNYSTRAPTDFVVSGSIGSTQRTGERTFLTIEAAERWARQRYGKRLKGRIMEAEKGSRWAFLVKQSEVN